MSSEQPTVEEYLNDRWEYVISSLQSTRDHANEEHDGQLCSGQRTLIDNVRVFSIEKEVDLHGKTDMELWEIGAFINYILGTLWEQFCEEESLDKIAQCLLGLNAWLISKKGFQMPAQNLLMSICWLDYCQALSIGRLSGATFLRKVAGVAFEQAKEMGLALNE